MSFISKMAKGYGTLLKNWSRTILTIIKITIFLLFVFSLSVLIVYPLWYLATNSPDKYSLLVGTLSLVFLLSYIGLKTLHIIKNVGLKSSLKKLFLPKIKKSLLFILTIFIILLTIYIYSLLPLLGIILTLITLFIFGYAKFVYKS